MQRRAVDFGLELQNFPSLITYSLGLWASDRTLLLGRQGGHGEDVMFTFLGQTWTNRFVPDGAQMTGYRNPSLLVRSVLHKLRPWKLGPHSAAVQADWEGVSLLERLWNWGWALKVHCFTPLLFALFVVGCDDISQLRASATLSSCCIGFLLRWTLNSAMDS